MYAEYECRAPKVAFAFGRAEYTRVLLFAIWAGYGTFPDICCEPFAVFMGAVLTALKYAYC